MQNGYLNRSVFYSVLLALLGFIPVVSVAQGKQSARQLFLSGVGNAASVSALIVNLQTSDTLVAIDPQKRLTPASVLKLATTAAALDLLGPGFKHRTRLVRSGNVVDSSLIGDLYVIGGGDPTLGATKIGDNGVDALFAKVVGSLQGQGINEIKGDVIVDASYFDVKMPPPGRIWEDIGNYYGAIPSGLSYRDNTFSLYLSSSGVPNQLCCIESTNPVLPDIDIQCRVKSSASQLDSAYVYGLTGLATWVVEGSIPVGQKNFVVKGALPNPPMFFGGDLIDKLKSNGIKVGGSLKLKSLSKPLAGMVPVCDFESMAMSGLVKIINVNSNNLLADNLFLTLGKEVGGEGSWDQSIRIVTEYWKKNAVGMESVRFADGCGLSPKNVVSARGIIDVLDHMWHSANFEVFKNSLAVSGQSGTLKNMWKTPGLSGKVFGKSGTMNGVVAYAGYFRNSKNEWCAFSIIVNNSMKNSKQVKALIELFVASVILV